MFNLNEHPDHLAISLAGELTIQNADRIKTGLLDALGRGKDISLDLAGVSELDSAGVQLLYYAKQMAETEQQSLQLLNHSPAVVEVFELYHLAPVFGDPMVLAADPAGAAQGPGAHA